ncbi:hypothetical protein ABFX02_11G071200 [Erythranthe guttata]
MVQNTNQEEAFPNGESKHATIECEVGESLLSPNSPNQNSRPTSMIIKKAHTVIPAHLVAEAISTLHGLDLRWSGPITPTERKYVQQYVFAKYPEYSNGLVVDHEQNPDLFRSLCINEKDESSSSSSELSTSKNSPKNNNSSFTFSPSSVANTSDMSKIQLEPSKLLDILAKKASFEGNFVSIPEIQARNRALENCGLAEEDYTVVFAPSVREAMMMVGEAYPFFRGNYYMSVLSENDDVIREFVSYKDSKVVAAPEAWLDLRIRGSQLSQYFRRKCKHNPKGLFAYPACTSGARSSMHWISEAHWNCWHVLLDASGLFDVGKGGDRVALALHRPDFVICTVEIGRAQPSIITCLLVRNKSFDIAASTSA